MAAPVAIVLNPRSGRAPEQQELDSALQTAHLHADIYSFPATSQRSDWIVDIARQHDIVVAAGGDGTASTVAASVIKAGKRFGVIPTGTLNHFARDAGIPLEIDDAIAVLAAGHTRVLDAGEVNGLVFLNNVSIGVYPRLVWERHRARQNGLPRPIALTAAAVRTWLDLRSFTVRLCVDDRDEQIRRTPFVLIGNSEYEVEGARFGRRPAMTDGHLSLYVAPDSGRVESLMLPIRALLGRLRTLDGFSHGRATSISVDLSRPRVDVGMDGEVRSLDSPLRFRIRRQALPTIVPAASRD